MQKKAVVTGANSGIGKETARALLQQGYELIMVCRNAEKAEATADEFKSAFPDAAIHIFICDLSSVMEIKKLAEKLKAQFISIDVLVNNAGAIFKTRELTADGFERTFATNHLAYFHLANALLPLLQAAPSARIVNVASQASKLSRLDFNDLQLEKKFHPGVAYGNSKLMNLLFTYALAKKLQGSPVTANVMHPGGVRTQFGRSLGTPMKIYYSLFGWAMRKSAQGADTAVWLATSAEAENVNGKYFKDRKEIKSIAVSYDEAVQNKLWDISMELINVRLK